MKKLMLLLSFFTFTAIAGVNAQCTKAASACCAKKSSTSASTTAVSGDAMVKKVANTSETKAACCSKAEAKACKKDASACQGATTGKVTEVTPAATKTRAPKPVEVVAPSAAQEDK